MTPMLPSSVARRPAVSYMAAMLWPSCRLISAARRQLDFSSTIT